MRAHRSWPRRLLIGANVFVALSLIAAASAFGYAQWRLGQIGKVHLRELTATGQSRQSTRTPVAGTTVAGPPETILIIGSDSRSVLNQPGDKAFGSGVAVQGARSDTIILARIVPATKSVTLLSIPRDTWVEVPGLGHQKINAAYGVGPDTLISVIRQQYGIDVNHYVDVNFDSFRDIADAVGGVEVYFPTPARDHNSGLSVPAAGCVNLVGDQALGFVRSREYEYHDAYGWHFESASDLARIQRQQIFIRKLVKKSESAGLTNLGTLNGIIGGLTKNLTVDDTFSISSMIDLARTFRSINPASITGLTMPATAATIYVGGLPDDILEPDPSADRAMVNQFLTTGAEVTTPATPTTTPRTSRTPRASGTTTTSTTSTTVPGVAPSLIGVQVENGSGVANQATSTAAALRSAGYGVTSITDAADQGRATTEIEYGRTGAAAAQTLAAAVSGATTLVEDASLSGDRLVLITGTSFTGITGSTASSATSSASSSSSVASSSTTAPSTTSTTIYELPGTPAGTTPPTCGD